MVVVDCRGREMDLFAGDVVLEKSVDCLARKVDLVAAAGGVAHEGAVDCHVRVASHECEMGHGIGYEMSVAAYFDNLERMVARWHVEAAHRQSKPAGADCRCCISCLVHLYKDSSYCR